MHFEIITATATQPNTGAAAAAVSGDSLTIRNGVASKGIALLHNWAKNQTAGFNQIIYPSGHDTTRGYRVDVLAGISLATLSLGMQMPVTPQETLAITIAGSNTAGDVEQMSMLAWYGDVPGITQRLMSPAEVERRTEKLTTIQASIVSAAGPGYSGAELINADSDLLLADRDYAVLGAITRTNVHAVCMRGPDLGNLRIGVPGDSTKPEVTGQFFMLLSRAHNKNLVPVINSGNRNSTYLEVATDENAGTFNVSWLLALLK